MKFTYLLVAGVLATIATCQNLEKEKRIHRWFLEEWFGDDGEDSEEELSDDFASEASSDGSQPAPPSGAATAGKSNGNTENAASGTSTGGNAGPGISAAGNTARTEQKKGHKHLGAE